MAKRGSEFLKGYGKGFQILKNIVDAVLALGGSDKDLGRLLTDSKLVKQIAEVIMSGKKVASDTCEVIVNYGETLEQMIKAGNYDFADGDIKRHLSIQGTGQHKVKLVLVHLDQDATTKEALEYLNSLGLEPAKVEHLLALGEAYPNAFQEFPVIALGSVWIDENGKRRFPYLESNGFGSDLDLGFDDDDNKWRYDWRFLALHK